MKKLLLILLLPCLLFSATGTWTGATSNVWAVNGNWSGATYPGTAATDTAIMGGISNSNDSLKAALTIKCLQMGNYSGILSLGNNRLTILFAGTGLNVFNGGSNLYTINGTGTIRFQNSTASAIDTIGDIYPSFTGMTDIRMNAASSTIYIKRIKTTTSGIQLNTSSASSSSKYVFIGDSVIATYLATVSTAGTFDSIYFGSTIFSFGAWDGTGVNAGTSVRMWQTAKFYASGNVTMSSSATVSDVPGTSLFTLNGTGAQTITSNGKVFYDLTVNNTGTSFVTRADSLTCHDLTLTDGPWNSATYGIRCDDLIHNSTDSVRYQNVWLTGNYTRGATATKSDTTGQHLRFLAGSTHTAGLGGKTYGQITLNAATALNGGAIIRALSYGVDGVKGTIEAGTKLTLNTFQISGSAVSPDSCVSGTPGAMDTISCPQDTPAYVYTRDQYMVNARYLPATSVSGGNNRNVKTLSYTGVTKDVSSGPAATTVTFTGYGFVGDCWVKFDTDSSALTVASYTSASKAVPALTPGVYAVTVGNSDGDQASVGNFTVESGITETPIISSIAPIWQKRGATFKLRGIHFKSAQGSGTLYLGISDLLTAKTWSDTLVIDTIPASWSPKGTYNVIIKNSDNERDTTQIRVLIPTITPGIP